MHERRSCVRWQIKQKAKIKLEGALSYMDCLMNDINFKGGKIFLKQHLTLDKFLKMNIMFSEVLNCDVQVWIVWHKRINDTQVYGFYFTKIKDSDKEDIYKFINRYFPDELRKQWWSGSEITKGGLNMENGKPEDKRVFSRFKVDYTVKFLNLDSYKEGQAETQDVSAKGIGFKTKQELFVNTPLEMWIDVPDKGQPLYTRGEVVWAKRSEFDDYRVGISLDKADLMGISRILRTL